MPHIEIDTSSPDARVVLALEELKVCETPQSIHPDSEPEFMAPALKQWAKCKVLELRHIHPG